jgi:hypothetical protein
VKCSHKTKILRNNERFELYGAMAMKFNAVWCVTQYSLLNLRQHFGVTCCLHVEVEDGGSRFLRNVCISENIDPRPDKL